MVSARCFTSSSDRDRASRSCRFRSVICSVASRHLSQRTEHSTGHQPAEHDRQHRHDAERYDGLDDELMEVSGVLGGGLRDELAGDLGLFEGGGPGLELRTVRRRADERAFDGDPLPVLVAHEQGRRGGVIDQHVGDGEQADAGHEEESAVEDRETKPNGPPG